MTNTHCKVSQPKVTSSSDLCPNHQSGTKRYSVNNDKKNKKQQIITFEKLEPEKTELSVD